MTTTFKNDLPFLKFVYAKFEEDSRKLSTIPGVSFSLTIQPMPPAITSKSGAQGGNSLGLNPSSDGALVLCLISATWDLDLDDAQIEGTAKTLYATIVEAAKAQGLFNDWVYLNYAGDFQDPIGGYGAKNRAQLQAASRKYDPRQVFQKNVPGGFKLF